MSWQYAKLLVTWIIMVSSLILILTGCGSSHAGQSPQFNGATGSESPAPPEEKVPKEEEDRPKEAPKPTTSRPVEGPNYDAICQKAGGIPTLDGECRFCDSFDAEGQCEEETTTVNLSSAADGMTFADFDRPIDPGLVKMLTDLLAKKDESGHEEAGKATSDDEDSDESESEEEESESGWSGGGGGGGCGC